LLFSLIAFMCLWEFGSLVLPEYTLPISRAWLIFFGMVPYVLAFMHVHQVLVWRELLVFPAMFFLVFVRAMLQSKGPGIAGMAHIALGVLYIGVPFALLQLMARYDGGYLPGRIAGLLFLTWANDTGAYLAGRFLGKRPLLIHVSPKKTWEGFLGGMVFAGLFAWILQWLPGSDLKPLDWWMLAILVSLFGPAGDLVESWLKREHQVKDSGQFLPGHGGFLDRFDAFLFHLPFCAFYIHWFVNS